MSIAKFHNYKLRGYQQAGREIILVEEEGFVWACDVLVGVCDLIWKFQISALLTFGTITTLRWWRLSRHCSVFRGIPHLNPVSVSVT